MAFDKQQPVTAQRVGAITVTLFDPDPTLPPGTGQVQQAHAAIDVVLSDGSTKTVHADIAQHFTATVLNQLKAFVASVRTKAIAEILP